MAIVTRRTRTHRHRAAMARLHLPPLLLFFFSHGGSSTRSHARGRLVRVSHAFDTVRSFSSLFSLSSRFVWCLWRPSATKPKEVTIVRPRRSSHPFRFHRHSTWGSSWGPTMTVDLLLLLPQHDTVLLDLRSRRTRRIRSRQGRKPQWVDGQGFIHLGRRQWERGQWVTGRRAARRFLRLRRQWQRWGDPRRGQNACSGPIGEDPSSLRWGLVSMHLGSGHGQCRTRPARRQRRMRGPCGMSKQGEQRGKGRRGGGRRPRGGGGPMGQGEAHRRTVRQWRFRLLLRQDV